MLRPPAASVTTSPFARCSRSAMPGLMATTLSHTTLVSGFGNSCSQAFPATLPSQTVGSGRNSTVRPGAGAAGVVAEAGWAVTDTSGSAVPRMKPSATDCCHRVSNAGSLSPLWWSRSRSRPPRVSSNSDRISGRVRPLYSGAMVGWISVTVPSMARASPQDSSGCARGMCQSE